MADDWRTRPAIPTALAQQHDDELTLDLFDILGGRVSIISGEFASAGRHEIPLTARDIQAASTLCAFGQATSNRLG